MPADVAIRVHYIDISNPKNQAQNTLMMPSKHLLGTARAISLFPITLTLPIALFSYYVLKI